MVLGKASSPHERCYRPIGRRLDGSDERFAGRIGLQHADAT